MYCLWMIRLVDVIVQTIYLNNSLLLNLLSGILLYVLFVKLVLLFIRINKTDD